MAAVLEIGRSLYFQFAFRREFEVASTGEQYILGQSGVDETAIFEPQPDRDGFRKVNVDKAAGRENRSGQVDPEKPHRVHRACFEFAIQYIGL
nr:hypothetical protein [Rhizobium sp. AP16]